MESKYTVYYTFDDPVPYKRLLLYPPKLRDYVEFYSTVDCLQLEIDGFEGSVEDKIKVIQMKYIDFLFFVSDDKNQTVAKLFYLLKLMLHADDNTKIYPYLDSNNHVYLDINGEIYDWQDFDEIKKIICEQNMIDLPDLTVQKEIRDNIRKGQEIKARQGTRMADLEGQILAIVAATGMSVDNVYSLSLRKFRLLVERLATLIEYKILATAKYSGFVEFKDKSIPTHWLADLKNIKDVPDGMMPIEEINKKVK